MWKKVVRRVGTWIGYLYGALIVFDRIARLTDLATYYPKWKPFFQWISSMTGVLNDTLIILIGLALMLFSEPGMWVLRKFGLLSSVYYESVDRLENLLFRVNWPKRGTPWAELDPYCRKCLPRTRMVARQPRPHRGEFEVACPNVLRCGTKIMATRDALATCADIAKSLREAKGRW